MPKPNPSDIKDENFLREFPKVISAQQKMVKESAVKFVSIVSQIDARIKVTGKYSSREYLFEKGGSVQDVEEKDVEWILSLRQGGRQCCGGSETGNVIFALA